MSVCPVTRAVSVVAVPSPLLHAFPVTAEIIWMFPWAHAIRLNHRIISVMKVAFAMVCLLSSALPFISIRRVSSSLHIPDCISDISLHLKFSTPGVSVCLLRIFGVFVSPCFCWHFCHAACFVILVLVIIVVFRLWFDLFHVHECGTRCMYILWLCQRLSVLLWAQTTMLVNAAKSYLL